MNKEGCRQGLCNEVAYQAVLAGREFEAVCLAGMTAAWRFTVSKDGLHCIVY